MDNFFTDTLADISLGKISEREGGDENPFIADLFNDAVIEVGHIQLVPAQNRLRITVSLTNGEHKVYNISCPRLEFLKFIFENTNPRVKKAVRYYFQNSSDARRQHAESKRQDA